MHTFTSFLHTRPQEACDILQFHVFPRFNIIELLKTRRVCKQFKKLIRKAKCHDRLCINLIVDTCEDFKYIKNGDKLACDCFYQVFTSLNIKNIRFFSPDLLQVCIDHWNKNAEKGKRTTMNKIDLAYSFEYFSKLHDYNGIFAKSFTKISEVIISSYSDLSGKKSPLCMFNSGDYGEVVVDRLRFNSFSFYMDTKCLQHDILNKLKNLVILYPIITASVEDCMMFIMNNDFESIEIKLDNECLHKFNFISAIERTIGTQQIPVLKLEYGGEEDYEKMEKRQLITSFANIIHAHYEKCRELDICVGCNYVEHAMVLLDSVRKESNLKIFNLEINIKCAVENSFLMSIITCCKIMVKKYINKDSKFNIKISIPTDLNDSRFKNCKSLIKSFNESQNNIKLSVNNRGWVYGVPIVGQS